MRMKDTLLYNHPIHGEIYIAHNTTAYELYKEKEWDKLNKLLDTEYRKCYSVGNKQGKE
jgi:hypothetical protein